MSVSELTERVATHTVLVSAWLAALLLPFSGPAALGLAAAGAISAFNFRGLTRGALWALGGAQPSGLWIIATGTRFLLLMAAVALLFASGTAHPVAVVAGLGVLPVVLVAHGLRGARRLEVTRG
jgi:hypothetical protein